MWWRHLPLGLVLFMVIWLGMTDLATGGDLRVLVTLLAPMFWVGLYLLGSNRAKES